MIGTSSPSRMQQHIYEEVQDEKEQMKYLIPFFVQRTQNIEIEREGEE